MFIKFLKLISSLIIKITGRSREFRLRPIAPVRYIVCTDDHQSRLYGLHQLPT
jgi:hypothetical protein